MKRPDIPLPIPHSLRLNRAISRLAEGTSISDIAQELGYAESKSFQPGISHTLWVFAARISSKENTHNHNPVG